MNLKIKNAKTLPRIYYGLHMVEGVAEYRDSKTNNGEPYRIFVGENAIKLMDKTFSGKPVYVDHVDEVDLDKIQEADGYVIESFFNKADGKHWAKFIIVSDEGHEAIKNGWKLSNAYEIRQSVGGGTWHAVDYVQEVKDGIYEHLAVVRNPRYEESIILTPEEFKAYNAEKEAELLKIANSKDKKIIKGEGMFTFFKREKVENSIDLEGMVVVLPKSKKEMDLKTVINEMDKVVNMQGYANGDHMVKIGEDEMSVNELVEKYQQSQEEMKNMVEKEKEKENEVDSEKEKEKENETDSEKEKENETDSEKEKENEVDPELENEEDEDKKNKKKNFNALSEAERLAKIKNSTKTIELGSDRVARGKSRYGSGN